MVSSKKFCCDHSRAAIERSLNIMILMKISSTLAPNTDSYLKEKWCTLVSWSATVFDALQRNLFDFAEESKVREEPQTECK